MVHMPAHFGAASQSMNLEYASLEESKSRLPSSTHISDL